jgi:hypothetical protein
VKERFIMWKRAEPAGPQPRPGACPFGIALAAGFVTAVAGSLLTSLVSAPDEATRRLVELSFIIAGFSATLRNPGAALLTAGMTWMVYLGFLVERAGELRWHGDVDLLRLSTLLAMALIGSARWPIGGLLSARSARMPRPRDRLRPRVLPEPANEHPGVAVIPPVRQHRS